jgi:uncharacterized membrane protein
VLQTARSNYQLFMWLILLLAVVLRIPQLNGSFWLDEAAQALESVRPLSQQLQIAEDFQPPLLHLIIHFASQLSHSEWWLRTIGALIPGVITIWATITIGAKLHHPKTGLLAGFLLATSPFHIFYSQELRPYSLPTLFATLSWLAVLTWPPTENWKPKRWRQFPTVTQLLVFVVLTSAGLFSSYLYPFVLLGQVTYLWFSHRTQIFAWGSAVIMVALTFVPWLPSFLEQLRIGGELRNSLPGWDTVVSLTQLKALPLVAAKFVFGIAPLSATPFVVIAALLLGCSTLALTIAIIHRKKLQASIWPLLIWIGIPLLSAWLVSFFIPVIQPKRVLFILPACYLLLASFTNKYLRATVRPNLSLPLVTHVAAVTVFVTVLVLNLSGVFSYYTQPQLQRENWRALFTTIEQRFSTNDTLVLFSFPDAFAPWRWYQHEFLLTHPTAQAFNTLSTGTLRIEQAATFPTQLEQAVEKYNTVLVFEYLRDLTDPNNILLPQLTELGLENTGVIEYPNIGFVRIYEHRY